MKKIDFFYVVIISFIFTQMSFSSIIYLLDVNDVGSISSSSDIDYCIDALQETIKTLKNIKKYTNNQKFKMDLSFCDDVIVSDIRGDNKLMDKLKKENIIDSYEEVNNSDEDEDNSDEEVNNSDEDNSDEEVNNSDEEVNNSDEEVNNSEEQNNNEIRKKLALQEEEEFINYMRNYGMSEPAIYFHIQIYKDRPEYFEEWKNAHPINPNKCIIS